MADDNNAGNVTANNKGHSIAASGIQPFCVPVHFIDKNTTIDADFAWKYYQYHQYFDLTMIHKFCFNLPHSQQQPINSYNNDIGWVIQIYQNVVNNIKQNCRMHLHNMICQRCKEVNWLLEGDRNQHPWMMCGIYFVQNITWYKRMVGYGTFHTHTTSYVFYHTTWTIAGYIKG